MALYLKRISGSGFSTGRCVLTGTDLSEIEDKRDELKSKRPIIIGFRHVPILLLKLDELKQCLKDGVSYISKEQEDSLIDIYSEPE